MTFIDGARVTKRRNGAGWCALLSKQISLQLPQERVQWKTVVAQSRRQAVPDCGTGLWKLKLRWPVDVNTLASSTHPVDADRRRGRPGHSPLVSILRRATSWIHFYTRTAVLKKILRRTGSQWRLHRTGVIWSSKRDLWRLYDNVVDNYW